MACMAEQTMRFMYASLVVSWDPRSPKKTAVSEPRILQIYAQMY